MGEAEKTYKIKVWHLFIAIIVMAVAGVLLFVYFSSSSSKNYVAVGNGWNYIKGNSPVINNGLLQVDFIGIEGCEFCAVERYALLDALSNFGNWTYYGAPVTLSTLPALNLTYSSEPQPNALFYKASEGDWTINFLNPNLKYSSNKVEFISRETANNGGQPFQQMTPFESQYLGQFDPLGYVPFVVLGGNFFETGAGASLVGSGGPIIFAQNGSGMHPEQILASFNLTGSIINAGITKESEYITAEICYDINESAPVCSVPAIKSIENSIKSAV